MIIEIIENDFSFFEEKVMVFRIGRTIVAIDGVNFIIDSNIYRNVFKFVSSKDKDFGISKNFYQGTV